jgi:hypothetical protein
VAAAHDLEARHVRQPGFQALRMLRPGAQAAAVRRAQHHRHAALATEHEARLGGLVHEGVHRQRDEVHEHDLDHRAQARQRRAHCGGDDARLGDRGVEHALRPELVEQAARGLERAAGRTDVLAHHDHARVGGHAVAQCLRDAGHVLHLGRAGAQEVVSV